MTSWDFKEFVESECKKLYHLHTHKTHIHDCSQFMGTIFPIKFPRVNMPCPLGGGLHFNHVYLYQLVRIQQKYHNLLRLLQLSCSDHIVACSRISFVRLPLSLSSSLRLPQNSLLFSTEMIEHWCGNATVTFGVAHSHGCFFSLGLSYLQGCGGNCSHFVKQINRY